MQLWNQLRTRTAGELRLIVEAAFLLGLIRIVLAAVSFATLRQTLDRCATWSAGISVATPQLIAWSVGATAKRLPIRHTCLSEALAADVMLRRRGFDSEVRLGVRKRGDDSQRLDGHAWVACDGVVVIGEVDDLAGYCACLISCPRG